MGISVTSGYYAGRPSLFIGESIVCLLTTFTASSIANFRGDSVRGAIMDETTLQTEDAFHAIESILRDGPNPFMWLFYNRTGPTSWVKRLIEDGQEDDEGNTFKFSLVEGFTWENHELPASYLHRLSRLTGHYKERDWYNRWTAASGLVYPHWVKGTGTFDANKIYLLAYDPAPVNTQAAMCIQRQADHWAVVDEIYTRRGATIRDARSALEQIEARWGKPHMAVLDPAAYEHVHQAIYVMHWRVLQPSTKVKEVTIPILRALPEEGKLRVNPATCPNTVAELGSVVYDEDTETLKKVIGGVRQEDHALDALRYISEFLEMDLDVTPLPPQAPPTFDDRWNQHYTDTAGGRLYVASETW